MHHDERSELSPKDSSDHLWNTKEVAQFLNVKESTIRHWVHIGYLPHIKFRGAVRYRREDILLWLQGIAMGNQKRSPNRISREILDGLRRSRA